MVVGHGGQALDGLHFLPVLRVVFIAVSQFYCSGPDSTALTILSSRFPLLFLHHHLSLPVPAVREVIWMDRRRSILFSLTPAPFSPY
jgi:hypothetical protein